jgi:hypothetical protein
VKDHRHDACVARCYPPKGDGGRNSKDEKELLDAYHRQYITRADTRLLARRCDCVFGLSMTTLRWLICILAPLAFADCATLRNKPPDDGAAEEEHSCTQEASTGTRIKRSRCVSEVEARGERRRSGETVEDLRRRTADDPNAFDR